MDNPPSLTPSQEIVLQAIYDEFRPTGKWPVFQHLDTVLDQDHGLDADEGLHSLWPKLVRIYTPIRPDTPVALRVAGLAHCAGSEDDLALFARTLRWMVEKERTFRPASPTQAEQQTLTSEELLRDWSAEGEAVSALDVAKALALIEIESIHAGLGSSEGSWTLTLSPQIRRYRGVRTYVDYLHIAEEDQAQQAPASPVVGGGPIVVVQPPQRVQVIGGGAEDDEALSLAIGELHPLVHGAIEQLFADSHYRQGVLDAALALRDLVRKRSGLATHDGDVLFGKALGGKEPPLVVADLSTETGRNIQRGTLLLAQGVWARMRNVLAHENVELDPTEAMEMVAIISRVVRDIAAGCADAGDSS